MSIQIVCQRLGIATVTLELDRLTVLGERLSVAIELVWASVVNLDVELPVCVDLVSTRSVSIIPAVVLHILAGSITPVVVPVATWSIALVRGGLPRELVCLHDVEFGAESAADLVCVAVVVSLATFDVVSVPVLAWHADLVESSVASALLSAQIDVVRD